ncbi:MAG: hypothetical protein SFX73_34790 [Kofleriaceae bacterium]|nr:hypothetical protein [Kofleriaceae bacterium]
MKLVRIEVEHFACIRRAAVELGPGLNVLYGPNDLGKSTLAQAIRAALLIQHTSAAADAFIEWESAEQPFVRVTFEVDRRYFQVEKRFGGSAGSGASLLRESNDGVAFSVVKKAREVDEELRTMLGWGIAPPGGVGTPRGLPPSFLATVLLGEQADVTGILQATLDVDSDESGRAKLTAALEAFAQDPIFKAVLDQAQAQVDTAFTPTGKKKKGQVSPFREVTDDVKRKKELLEQIAKRVAETDAAERTLQECQAKLARCAEGHADAVARLNELKVVCAQAAAVGEAERQLAVARGELARIESEVTVLSQSELALGETRAKLEQKYEEKARVTTKRDDALAAQKAAEEALRVARSDDAEKERRLRQGELERERLELEVKARTLRSELDALAKAREAEAHLARTEEQRNQVVAELERLAVEREAVRAQQEDAGRQLDVLDVATRVVDRQKTQREIERLEKVRADVEVDRASAAEKREQAAALEADVPAGLPSPDELAALRSLRHELEVAEARLGGGIAIAVERLKKVAIEVHVDGTVRDVPAEGAFTLEVERTLGLRIGDLARVTVTAGEKEARAAAETLARRWATESAPIFESAAVQDFDALAERVSAADEVRRRIAELRNAASGIEARIPGNEAQFARLPDLEYEAAAFDRELGGKPVGEAEKLIEELGAGSLDGRRSKLRTARNEAESKLQRLNDAISAADRNLSALGERLDAVRRDVEQRGIKRPDAGWDAEAARLAAVLDAVGRNLGAIAAELGTLTAERAAEVERAETGVKTASAAAESATSSLNAIAAEVDALRAEAARLEGVIETQRRLLEQRDLDAARGRVHAAAAALNALPEPARRVDDDELAGAERTVDETNRAYETAKDEARKAEGALETVGGQVVREEQQITKEALRLAEQKERDVEVEFDAWRLLVDKLREAETVEGQHLGEALAVPVSQRFAALTGGRYGKLEVTPQLETKGVRAAGALRSTTSLSVGTQEQLATLLRLTVAEHLGSFLVLDDHLTQTDSARSKWFLDKLREHADKAQIVVLTCRPLDYVREVDLPGEEIAVTRAGGLVRVVDLDRVIASSTRSPERFIVGLRPTTPAGDLS